MHLKIFRSSLNVSSILMLNNYKKKLFALIIISSVIRLVVAAVVELGNDEVYYWTYAQHLQWNYFDHPPMVAVWIRFFTANLSLQQYEVFIRLGSILSCAAATTLIFDTVKKIHSEKAGWFAALLYNASLYAAIIAGLFIMPDSPQMLFWTACLWIFVQISNNPGKWSLWVLFGLISGLCIMSKIHAVFLWTGLGLFILFKKRDCFKLPQLYVAALITALVASPILFWNMANDFITYRFHSERVAVEKFSLNWTGFGREFFGQIFYNNPFNVVIAVAALLATARIKKIPVVSLYNFVALPMIAILIIVSLFRNTFPHWSGPAYVTLIPLSSIYLAERSKSFLLRWSVLCSAFFVIVGTVLINFYPGTLGKKSTERLGAGDFTLDTYGWKDAGKKFAYIREQEISAHHISTNAPMIAYKWFPAAHEDYYFCRPLKIEMIGIGNMHDLHNYAWSNKYRLTKTNLNEAWCVIPSNEKYDIAERYGSYYSRIDSVSTITSLRNGNTCRYFYVYRLSGWKSNSALVQ
jgi:hypothetical protein